MFPGRLLLSFVVICQLVSIAPASVLADWSDWLAYYHYLRHPDRKTMKFGGIGLDTPLYRGTTAKYISPDGKILGNPNPTARLYLEGGLPCGTDPLFDGNAIREKTPWGEPTNNRLIYANQLKQTGLNVSRNSIVANTYALRPDRPDLLPDDKIVIKLTMRDLLKNARNVRFLQDQSSYAIGSYYVIWDGDEVAIPVNIEQGEPLRATAPVRQRGFFGPVNKNSRGGYLRLGGGGAGAPSLGKGFRLNTPEMQGAGLMALDFAAGMFAEPFNEMTKSDCDDSMSNTEKEWANKGLLDKFIGSGPWDAIGNMAYAVGAAEDHDDFELYMEKKYHEFWYPWTRPQPGSKEWLEERLQAGSYFKDYDK